MSDKSDCTSDLFDFGLDFDPSFRLAKEAFKLGYSLGSEISNLESFQLNKIGAERWDVWHADEWRGGRRPSKDYSNF